VQSSWRRYVALGDSFTEGLSDHDPDRPGEFRGWADRLAEHLAAAAPGDVEYANLAIRGRLLRQVVDEQVPVALAARPDLVSLVAGGNDLMRPGSDPDELAATLEGAVVRLRASGADVLLATGVDTRQTPAAPVVRPRPEAHREPASGERDGAPLLSSRPGPRRSRRGGRWSGPPRR
jgi:lysophospholipase L1-like esterase